MAAEINWTVLDPAEKSRTYYFADKQVLHIKDVVKIEVRSSGKHRIETKDGKKFWVNTGWLWMEIDTPEWTA